MRNKLKAIILITILSCSCSKNEPMKQIVDETITANTAYEKIYKATGCKVINAETISILNSVFVDSSGFKYLYGARNSGDNIVFWVSKYSSDGSLIWETNKTPNNEKYTRAFSPKELSNGDITIACIVDKSRNTVSDGSKEMLPTILSKSDGSAYFIKVVDKYFYSYTNVYDGFFLCGISDAELTLNASARRWFSQISNIGKVLLSIPEMSKTNESTIFISNDEFFTAEERYIERAFLNDMKSPKWQKNILLPEHKSFKQKLSLDGGILRVTYNLVLPDNQEQIVDYVLDAETGKECKEATSIELDTKELSLDINKTYQLKATVYPLGATNAKIIWKSSDDKVALVDDSGLITAISEGKCEVSANINGTNLTSYCTINVSTIKATRISLNESSININTGSRFKLIATVYPSNASNTQITWTSSNEKIALVDNNGWITAISEGECEILANIDGTNITSKCSVSISTIKVTGISLNKSSANIKTGSQIKLEATIHPVGAYSEVKWSTSNSSVATINDGVVYASKQGECVITATTTIDGQFTASCTITVNDPIITDMMKLSFPSSSVLNINGFITGTIYSAILNTSKNDITLTRFEVVDSNTNRVISYTEDQSKLGVLQSNSKRSLQVLLNSVYNPKCTWFFKFEGKDYQISHYFNE